MRKPKKTEQINIRFTAKAVEDLDRIADAESRDRSELARFLVEWAMAQYDLAGSLRSLMASSIHKQAAKTAESSPRELTDSKKK